MPQTEINSLFTANGIPATDIGTITPGYPRIRIWEVDGATQTLIVGSPDGIMTEMVSGSGSPLDKDGFYSFVFTAALGYDQTKKYVIRTDGGVSLPSTDQYQSGEIESSTLDKVLVPDHQIPGSMGETLSLIKADTTQLFLDVSDVKTVVDLILKFDTNRTKIDDVAKTLTIYDDDCITVLRVFQLLDQTGTPSTDSVCERKPISGGNDGKPVCP